MQIQTTLVQIGNSKGIRIPAKIIEATKLTKEINIEILENSLLISPVRKTPREGWAKEFKTMHDYKEDKLLIDDDVDNELLSQNKW